MLITLSTLLLIGAVSLLCAVLFPHGPVLALFGLVVTSSGPPASRLRRLSRQLVVWAPLAIAWLTAPYWPGGWWLCAQSS